MLCLLPIFLDTWLISTPIFQLAFWEIMLKSACRLMAANEVENLHPVLPWQHLTLSASPGSPLWLLNCALIDLIFRASSRGQEHIWHAWRGRVCRHARTHTHTHANAHSWSEMAYGRHAVLRLQTGESGEVRRRERELQTGSGGRISPSLHDNPLILSYTVKQQFCLPLSLSASLYVINASVSQRTCDTYGGINIILVLCEDVRGW